MIADAAVVEAPAAEAGAYAFHDEAILGTRMTLQVTARSFAAAQTAALAVRTQIDRLDGILSGWRDDSELARLNSSEALAVSPELFAVVTLAEEWRRSTAGAFSGRLGRVTDLWRTAQDAPPDRDRARRVARAAEAANVQLDPETRTIHRPQAVVFTLDGLAKGWIIDRAFDAAMASPGVQGALVEIGGDVRCGGIAPGPEGWRVAIADPRLPYDNAPDVALVTLRDHGLATSGQGPRDRILQKIRYSPTLSPFDGWPVAHNLSASVVASCAADADALATAALVLPAAGSEPLLQKHNAAARVTPAEDAPRQAGATEASARFIPVQSRPAVGAWPDGWQALATFTAPRRQLIRDPSFRSPYMVMWITDTANKPVRTLLLVGKRPEWQRDNFIWWRANRGQTDRLVAVRSMGTSGAGVYNVFWNGVDDRGNPVPSGRYILHVETSRELGKHTYRTIPLDFSKAGRFTNALPSTEEGGGLKVTFDHY